VSGSSISWAICKSAPCSRQITMPTPTTQFFIGRMPFLPPNQQRQSTEGISVTLYNVKKIHWYWATFCIVWSTATTTVAKFNWEKAAKIVSVCCDDGIPCNMVDNGREVCWTIQLDSLQCLIIRLQHALNALTVRISRMTVLQSSNRCQHLRAGNKPENI